MKKTISILLALIMLLSLTGCGSSHAKHTVDATLSGDSVPKATVIQWFKDANTAAANAANVQLAGKHVISFALTGNEEIDGLIGDFALSEINLTFTGMSSAQTATVSNSALDLLNKLNLAKYFKVDGNQFTFSTGYFANGEVVEVKASFIYKRYLDGNKVKEGYFYFTVGAGGGGASNTTNITATQPTQPSGSQGTQPTQPSSSQATQPTQPSSSQATQPTQPSGSQATQPTQPSGSQGTQPGSLLSGWFSGLFAGGNGNASGKNKSGYFFVEDMRFHIAPETTDHFVYKYEDDSEENPIDLWDEVMNMTVYTRENGYDIVKAYLVMPDGTMIGHSNHETWRSDNCHKFEEVNLAAYAGQTITLGIRFAAGNEILPMEYMNGFITVTVPK